MNLFLTFKQVDSDVYTFTLSPYAADKQPAAKDLGTISGLLPTFAFLQSVCPATIVEGETISRNGTFTAWQAPENLSLVKLKATPCFVNDPTSNNDLLQGYVTTAEAIYTPDGSLPPEEEPINPQHLYGYDGAFDLPSSLEIQSETWVYFADRFVSAQTLWVERAFVPFWGDSSQYDPDYHFLQHISSSVAREIGWSSQYYWSTPAWYIQMTGYTGDLTIRFRSFTGHEIWEYWRRICTEIAWLPLYEIEPGETNFPGSTAILAGLFILTLLGIMGSGNSTVVRPRHKRQE